jgi:hypothetical protein
VVAVRTEREPNRYEPLNETHRRVAEEEEKRRLAEQEQARSAQPEPEPYRPGTEPRPQRPETGLEHDPDSPEARLAAMQRELEEKVRLGRINSSEMIYQLRQFDNQLRVEMEEGRTPLPAQQHDLSGNSRDEMTAGAEHAEPESPQRVEPTHDRVEDRSAERPSERLPESRIEREAQAAEYEIVGRGEMSDARAARLERLRGIDRDIERENRENEGEEPNLDHYSDGRSP